jgi:hypothetical protein
MAILKEAVTLSGDVFVFLDALDECPKSDGEREKLLDTLHVINSWNMDSLHILATSRRESDIEESFRIHFRTSDTFQAIRVQGVQVENDIRKFIRHILQHPSHHRWSVKLKKEVEANLASQADGM